MMGKAEGEKPKVELKQPSDSLVGEKVEVRLMDGGHLQGKLKEVGGSEVVLEGRDGDLIVFKHAVAYIIPLKSSIHKLMEEEP